MKIHCRRKSAHKIFLPNGSNSEKKYTIAKDVEVLSVLLFLLQYFIKYAEREVRGDIKKFWA